ncbi:MAG TPA: DinB family protein [Gemmatimonadales bacterium]|jgi:uncharacterized damage-inducible protein DinB
MIARARDLLNRLTQLRHAMLVEANGLSAEELLHRPGAGAWSILDVIEHLVRVEEAILSRVRKRDPRTWGEAARARVRLALVSILFVCRGRLRVPTQAVVPLGGVTLTDLAARWETSQDAMRRTLDGFGPADYSRPLMRHPILGLLTPVETLTFLVRHIAHHRRQVARIRSSRYSAGGR